MSLVGPRPCLPYEYDKYLPWQKERFETVPGLTGLWQVSGKNKTTFVEMIQLDIKYAKNKNFWWDLKIILMTIPALMIQMLETRLAGKAASRSGYAGKPVIPIVPRGHILLRKHLLSVRFMPRMVKMSGYGKKQN